MGKFLIGIVIIIIFIWLAILARENTLLKYENQILTNGNASQCFCPICYPDYKGKG